MVDRNVFFITRLKKLGPSSQLSSASYYNPLLGQGCFKCYHEDAIHDVVSGLNVSPSLVLFCRLAELHQVAWKDLYERVKKAIVLSIFQKKSSGHAIL